MRAENRSFRVVSQSGGCRTLDESSMNMPTESRLPDGYGDEQPRELLELGRLISELPEAQFRRLESAFHQVAECVTRRRRILTLVQEALAQLRLDIKYLMFDLEVTRQERDELKEQLDQIERDGYERF